MTRETILEAWKDIRLTVKNKPEELKEPYFFSVWSAKRFKVMDAINGLSEEDKVWFDQEYKVWFDQNIKPDLNEAQKKLLEERKEEVKNFKLVDYVEE